MPPKMWLAKQATSPLRPRLRPRSSDDAAPHAEAPAVPDTKLDSSGATANTTVPLSQPVLQDVSPLQPRPPSPEPDAKQLDEENVRVARAERLRELSDYALQPTPEAPLSGPEARQPEQPAQPVHGGGTSPPPEPSCEAELNGRSAQSSHRKSSPRQSAASPSPPKPLVPPTRPTLPAPPAPRAPVAPPLKASSFTRSSNCDAYCCACLNFS